MRSHRVAVRLARREVLRRPGRTLLVALLVAIPVAGMTSAAVLIRSDHQTPDQEWQRYYGQADATYSAPPPAADPADAEQYEQPELPDGSRTVAVTTRYTALRTTDRLHRRSGVRTTDTPLGDPLTAGTLDLLEGRGPTAEGEVAMSRRLLDHLDGRLGERLDLDTPTGALSVQVVGVVEQPSCLGCDQMVVPPGGITAMAGGEGGEYREVLVDLPDGLTEAQLGELGRQPNLQLRSTYPEQYGPGYGEDDGTAGVRWSLVVGAVVLMVMGIVITAAFAVGARRQLVVLGQLSASGAAPATVRASLFLQGSMTGVLGAVGGVALALGGLVAFQGRVEELLGRRIEHLSIRVGDLLSAMAVGVLAATIAALLPARTAAQVSTLSALAGRRPQSRIPARAVAAGTVAVIVGLAFQAVAVLGGSSESGSGNVWVVIAILGGVGELLGACALAPVVVARLEPLAGRLRGSWRLGARSLARSRTRTGAVVSAIAAAGALAILSIALVRGSELQSRDHLEQAPDTVVASVSVSEEVDAELGIWRSYRELPPAVVDAGIAAVLPEAERSVLRIVELPTADPRRPDVVGDWIVSQGAGTGPYFDHGYAPGQATVADEALVDAVGLSPAERATLEEHGAALLVGDVGDPGDPSWLLRPPGGTEPLVLPRLAVDHSLGHGGEELVMTAALAAELGLEATPGAHLYRNPEPLTQLQRDAVDDLFLDVMYSEGLESSGTTSRYLDLALHHPDTGISPFQLELILSGVALVFALFVVGVSLGLAAAESKDERDVLTVAGAPPGALARSAGARAFLMSLLGSAMAVPVGFLPVLVFALAETEGFVVSFPVTVVGLLLVAVPVVVGTLALATSATAQRLHPVRVSTATWE